MKQYFGIDIGGTAVKLGIVDETGRVLLKGEESVSFDGYQTPVLTTVRKAAKEFLTTNSIPVESLAGIGVSATGQIDSRKGIVAGTCGNFPNYIGSWATTAPTRWTVWTAPAAQRAAGNATPPPPRWCAPHRKRTPIGKMAAPSLLLQKQATKQFLPCWMHGRTRSHRGWRAWCTSSIRSSS